MDSENSILQVALPSPLRKTFDYLPPLSCNIEQLVTGSRIRVPFGKREAIGIILKVKKESQLPRNKLKHALELLDSQPLFNPRILSLYEFASQYYQHSIGDIIFSSLPPLLREGQPATLPDEVVFVLTKQGALANDDLFKHATQQKKIIELLKKHHNGLSKEELLAANGEQKALTALLAKGFVQKLISERSLINLKVADKLLLNDYQQQAVQVITHHEGFGTFLLEGVTGSGKTEVYLQCIETMIKNNQQTLLLVPEIGLTPQTVARFQARFNSPISILHSGLSEKERSHAWLAAFRGISRIVIGTRSAVLTPLPSLGMIILDEEHDPSFKQQSGFRYSARDLAVMRGKLENLPVILGSATPCLESLFNVKQKRFHHITLPVRAGKAMTPTFHLIDVRSTKLQEGFSPIVIQKIKEHLENKGQVLIYLNRRGYAPTLLCHRCGWIASCSRCDARFTYHSHLEKLVCHHCSGTHEINKQCGSCRSRDLVLLGMGTQRIEKMLTHYFPNAMITRIDRDSTRKKGAMDQMLSTIHTGQSNILIGTQMLAKGHHFPDVTMVVITDIDNSLYSTDFRACERLGQIVVQVAGRAGRSEKPGEVYLQTHNPNHPLLLQLIQYGYQEFADSLLEERRSTNLPPFSHLSLFRAQASTANLPKLFLEEVRTLLEEERSLKILGPVPALMEKKVGQFRAQLLIQSKNRNSLQKILQSKISMIENLPSAKKVRWSIDVDPIEVL